MILNPFVYFAAGFSGLLDDYPGAARAYSLRALDADFETSDLITVRRSSDDATASYTEAEINDGTLLTWVGTGGTDQGYVTSWVDQSGNASNLVQVTEADQPQIVVNGALYVDTNGNPGIYFDGSGQHLDFASGVAVTDGHVFIVYKMDTTDTTQSFAGSGTGASGTYLLLMQDGSTTAEVYREMSVDSDYINGAVQSLANRNEYFDAIGAGTDAKLFGIDGLTTSENLAEIGIGGLNDTFSLKGHFSEFIIYSSDQVSNQTNIEANINSHYGLWV